MGGAERHAGVGGDRRQRLPFGMGGEQLQDLEAAFEKDCSWRAVLAELALSVFHIGKSFQFALTIARRSPSRRTRMRFEPSFLSPSLAAAARPRPRLCRRLAQDVQERVIRFGHLNNADHPVSLGVKRFAELVAAKSGGKIKVQEFPASHARQRAAAAVGAAGRHPGDVGAGDDLARRHRQGVRPGRLPVRGRNFAQADALLDGPLGQALIARLPEKGLVALGYWDLGFRNVTNSKRPITKAEDLDGLKIRVIPEPGVPRHLQGVQGQPGADALRRALRRARVARRSTARRTRSR